MDVNTVSTLADVLARNPMAAMTAVMILAATAASVSVWGFLKLRVNHIDRRDTDRDRNIIDLTRVGFETLGKVTEVVRNCEVSMMRQSDTNTTMVQSNNAISMGLQQVASILKEVVEVQKDHSEQMRAVDRRLGRLEVNIEHRVPRRT